MTRTTVLVAGLVLGAAAAAAMELAGVTLPDAHVINGTTLRLNGMGVRKKIFVKVYVGGLYLTTPSHDAAAMPALRERLDAFCAMWPDMKSGEKAFITYLPGTGTILVINGKQAGLIPGQDFAAALFAVWLGAVPADSGLKAGLLGRP